MSLSSRIIAIIAAAAPLVGAPIAMASTSSIGDVASPPVNNVCLFTVDCSYVNFAHGKPTDVVKHSGTVVRWSALQCGALQLRVLQPAGHGKFRFVRSSAIRSGTAPGVNTFPAHIPVRAGDVLALRDAGSSTLSSCLMFASAGSGHGVRYYRPSPADGATAEPTASTTTDQNSGQGDSATPHLRVLFSATVKS
jgi:hypothetical protein